MLPKAALPSGRLEHGFVRVKCTGYHNELLVAFSCKHRGFCPSCGGCRMIDTAAHLVDRVLPAIPIHQWVLSFPYPLRLLYSTHPQAMTRTLGIVLRALETHLIRMAGLTRASGAGSGAITFIQRFGSALNLNVHLHMLIPDGVYTLSHGKPRFHAVPAPSHSELTALLNRIIRRITRQLTRDGLLVEDANQTYLDLQPGLLYYLAVSTDGGDILYKIGITNLSVEKRFPSEDVARIRIIKVWPFEVGHHAATREAEILHQFAKDRYLGPGVLVGAGNSELEAGDRHSWAYHF